MSEIIMLNGAPARSTKKANDFATLADVAMVSQQSVIEIFGPMAQLCTELASRVQVLEDKLGIVAPEVRSPTTHSWTHPPEPRTDGDIG